MRGLRTPRLWTRLNFSVKFALIIAVVGVLIAIIPLSLASRDNRIEATQRASDKSAVVVNLIRGQQRSLAAFASGMSQELLPTVGAGDTTMLHASLLRYSQVNTTSDLVGVHGSFGDIAVRGGVTLAAGDSLYGALVAQLRPADGVTAGPDGNPWLVAASPLTGTDEWAFIARPIDSRFLAELDGAITTTADPAGIAIVRDGRIASSGGSVLTRRVPRGATADSGLAPVLDGTAAAQVVDVGGLQVGAAGQRIGDGFVAVVTTSVSEVVGTLWQPLAFMLGLIALAVIFIIVVVQTDLQRPLRRLDRAVAALARDEYDVPVPRAANDEIGRLASSFEEMRRQLRATMSATRARAIIASELNSPQPLETALGEVCAQLRASAGGDTAFILVNGSEMANSFTVSDGDTIEFDVAALLGDEGPIGSAYRHSGPDALMIGAAPGSPEAATGLRDFCVAPLRMGPNVLGVVGIGRREGGFSPGDASLVSSSAEQVALALERYRFIAMVQRQASIDDLTGLYNHRFLIDYLGQQVALAERLNTPLAVLVIDLDHFKRVNDTHGHPTGDSVLTAFAQTLTGSIRRADLAARYGGEEFIVVMSNTAAREARLVAEKIRAAAAAMLVPIEGGRAAVLVTVSVGGAAYPEDTTTAAELLATADTALYDAKRSGRNRVCMAGGDTPTEESSNVTSVVRPRRSAQ